MSEKNNYYDTKTGEPIDLEELEAFFKRGVKPGDHFATGLGIRPSGYDNQNAPEATAKVPSQKPLPGNNDPIIRAVHLHSEAYRRAMAEAARQQTMNEAAYRNNPGTVNAQRISNAIPTQEAPSRPPVSHTQPAETQKKKIPTNASKERCYQEALNNSCAKSEPIKRNKNNRTKVAKTVVALAIVMAMSIASYKIVEKGVTNITDDIHMSQVSEASGQIINGHKTPNIVSKNTYRTSDYQNFYFDNLGIAKDLLQLPDQTFLAALTTVYIQ